MDMTLRYTLLGIEFVAMLDRGGVLDIDETREHLEDGSLFAWLKSQYGDDINLSEYRPADQAEVLDRFASLANAVDARRKFGVERNGLALLAAYCFEMLQEMHAAR